MKPGSRYFWFLPVLRHRLICEGLYPVNNLCLLSKRFCFGILKGRKLTRNWLIQIHLVNVFSLACEFLCPLLTGEGGGGVQQWCDPCAPRSKQCISLTEQNLCFCRHSAAGMESTTRLCQQRSGGLQTFVKCDFFTDRHSHCWRRAVFVVPWQPAFNRTQFLSHCSL